MKGERGREIASWGKVIAIPRVRKTSFSRTIIEFAHSLILMLWVGTLSGIAVIVIPSLFYSLPNGELAIRAMMEILERGAILGCCAGAFLLITTLLMHLFSLRGTQAVFAQVLLLLIMTFAAVTSQIVITPKMNGLIQSLASPLAALPSADPKLEEFARLRNLQMGALTIQIASGMLILFLTVRRWYRYVPEERGESAPSESAPPQGP